MRTAIFCNDAWHSADTLRPGFAALAGEPFDFSWLETPAQWTGTDLSPFGLIVLAKGNTTAPDNTAPWLTPAVEQALARHVASGRGLVLVHAGTAGYRQTACLGPLSGGGFVQHPPPCLVQFEPVASHPITAGLSPFQATDEHYFMSLDAAVTDVFLHAVSEHGQQAAGWRLQRGPGRVIALTPGHTAEVWQHPAFQTCLRRSLRWAAGLD